MKCEYLCIFVVVVVLFQKANKFFYIPVPVAEIERQQFFNWICSRSSSSNSSCEVKCTSIYVAIFTVSKPEDA